uniref:B30.2/SPRY domain-containing protein n=1 Tax=Lepisosteus oculatus TaxID=7918 RepID=W5M549_LEPOC
MEHGRLAVDLEFERARRNAVDVTLDPRTAHPHLIVSRNGKQVRHGDIRQDLPDNPERFTSCVDVLGKDGFTSGRHYWEVKVGKKTEWDLGVVRESIKRKKQISLSTEDGFWTLGLRNRTYTDRLAPLMGDHLQRVQGRQKECYDRSVQQRIFLPGNRVMLLLPSPECKLYGRWQGPYEICERTEPVTYRVYHPDHRKKDIPRERPETLERTPCGGDSPCIAGQ